tara:strand:- start:2637 stop:2984 length:348 start_codon:yes stop_codon:yes gene_type:complete
MKILIAGGRDFTDKDLMQNTLAGVPRDSVVISGTARGADKMGEDWAEARGIPVERYPALWEEHGRAAGHIRNQLMLDEGQPDLVVVFPGGKGSESMVKKARKAGVDVMTPGWVVV